MNDYYLYEDQLKISLPSSYNVTKKEKDNGIRTNYDYLFSNLDDYSLIGLILNEKALNKQDVELSLKQYYAFFSRMAPGFQMGEAKIKRTDNYDIGFLTFKSNSIDKDIFNVVAIMNFINKELLISFASNMEIAVEFLPKVISIIDSITVIGGR